MSRPAAVLVSLLVLALVSAGGVYAWQGAGTDELSWRTEAVTRRDVQRVVSSTGTLQADPAVDVGTQVSGVVAELLVDFNDKVEKGQVLARIDPTLLQADVASAEARLSEARAGRDRLALGLRRMEALHERAAATDAELEVARADAAVAEAQVTSTSVGVERARRNLGYSTVTAPVAGTIIKRNVNLGQTVNAGFSAPILFTLASDLTRMVILASVDESDVAQVQAGQAVTFTVQAWPERTFSGTVRQVRLDSKIDQGVVTYSTVVNVDNTDGALFPSMTATVEFIVAQAAMVLCAPNAALRYRPESDLPIVGEAPKSADASGAEGGRGGRGGRQKRAEATTGVLWTLDGGALRAIPVTVGLRGAECAEVAGDGLTDGVQVVLGVDRGAESGAGNPFEQKAGDARRPGGF